MLSRQPSQDLATDRVNVRESSLVRFRLGLLFHQAFAIALDLFPVRLVFRGNDRVCAGARVAVFQERVIALRAKRGLWPEPTVVRSRARVHPLAPFHHFPPPPFSPPTPPPHPQPSP